MERAYVYGDSLLKATVPDEAMRYHFHLAEVMARYPTERLEVVNRAKMGSTISKGLSLVAHDVQRGMDALMENRTVFVIAHRLSTVRNSNCIVVIEGGQIMEKGDHADLLEQKGRYYQLYTGQFELE